LQPPAKAIQVLHFQHEGRFQGFQTKHLRQNRFSGSCRPAAGFRPRTGRRERTRSGYLAWPDFASGAGNIKPIQTLLSILQERPSPGRCRRRKMPSRSVRTRQWSFDVDYIFTSNVNPLPQMESSPAGGQRQESRQQPDRRVGERSSRITVILGDAAPPGTCRSMIPGQDGAKLQRACQQSDVNLSCGSLRDCVYLYTVERLIRNRARKGQDRRSIAFQGSLTILALQKRCRRLPRRRHLYVEPAMPALRRAEREAVSHIGN